MAYPGCTIRRGGNNGNARLVIHVFVEARGHPAVAPATRREEQVVPETMQPVVRVVSIVVQVQREATGPDFEKAGAGPETVFARASE